MADDDRELWERTRRGDAHAFDVLYRTYGPKLEAFLRVMLGSKQAAEDVMQETFAQIWQRPNGFEPGRGTLGAYLFGAGRKRAAEWWRNHDSPDKPLQDQLAPCDNETASLVGDAFERLPEEQRTLIWLREVEGHSCAELAAMFEIPVGTVRSRLFAAREGLRKIWQARPKEKEDDR